MAKSRFVVVGRRADYSMGGDYAAVIFDGVDLYRKAIETASVADLIAEVAAAKVALAGQDAHVSVMLREGRSPNGFKAWANAAYHQNFVRAVAP